MLLGLGESVANVSAGAGGSTIITQPGKKTVIQLPTINIVGKVPAAKPSALATVPPSTITIPGAPLGPIQAGMFGADPMRNGLLVAGVLAIGAWLFAGDGQKVLGKLLGGGKRRGGRRRHKTVRNPRGLESHPDPRVRKAVKFREDFHWGIPARKVERKRISPQPEVLVELGKVKSITYETHKKGEEARWFEHDFEGRWPTLAMDIENKRLHLVGGSYTVTDDGITG